MNILQNTLKLKFLENTNNIKMTNLKTNFIILITLLTITLISINATAQLHVIKPDGNVGIGMETPTQKLEVAGNVKITGNKMTLGTDAKPTNTFIDLYNGLPGNGKFKTAGRFIANTKGHVSFMAGSTGDFTLRTWNPSSGISFTVDNASRFRIKNTGLIEMGPQIGADGNLNNSTILSVNGNAQKTGGGSWEVLSDARLKTDVENYSKGLAEILQINPVTYKYTGVGGVADTEKKQVGLIAQEFQKIAPEAIGTYKHTEPLEIAKTMEDVLNGTRKKMADLEVVNEYLTLDNSSITYMLVNAVKEQQTIIETQKAELETLKATVTKLAQNSSPVSTPGATEISVLLEGTGTENVLLAQNTPNPFTTKTRIEYFIPTNSRNARMSFRDMTGKEIKRVELTNDGIGAIELSAKDLAAGIYSYVLYVNGSIVASKKMVLKQ